ncbi:hypothetical protein H2203_001078 [Taxawa tesnikishii (nom. ined.)]|nr:hypothetical protein H2203_001078 [Dothideales sp. JES 119]
MADVTPAFNTALKAHNVPPVTQHTYSKDQLDEFLKEAYSINARIVDLYKYLRAIRPSYLSTAPPPRNRRQSNTQKQGSQEAAHRHLTDNERAAIDAEAKTVLRQLHSAVSRLAQTEQIRKETASHIALRKRAKTGLSALGRWAAGGAVTAKSVEEEANEAKEQAVSLHRESVIWYLQRQLERAGNLQSGMMEVRISREIEKSKSVLYKSRVGNVPYEKEPAELSMPDGMQLFAQENQEMLKHYEDTLDQVRTTEKSLLEISELQTTLAANLALQSENIGQLVQDSYLTTENVDKGNKQLRKASERTSTARLLFYSTCGFCTFLVVWDLIF